MLSPLWSIVTGASEWCGAETYLYIWMPLKGTKTADWGNLCVCARMQRFFSTPVQQKGQIRVPLKTTWMAWRLITSPGPYMLSFIFRKFPDSFQNMFSVSAVMSRLLTKIPFSSFYLKYQEPKNVQNVMGFHRFWSRCSNKKRLEVFIFPSRFFYCTATIQA